MKKECKNCKRLKLENSSLETENKILRERVKELLYKIKKQLKEG